MTDVLLSAHEARVIASLVEKSLLTPAYYPMTVNALMLASNQKTSRQPLMNLTEGEVGAALTDLESKDLAARDYPGGRVPKWRHNFQHRFLLNAQTMAVLVTLMLRGPQTVSELRANAANLGGPADADALAAALKDLADRAQPLVALQSRAPGQKESRYAHLLCGTPPAPAVESSPRASSGGARDGVAGLEERLRALEERVAALERAAAPQEKT